VILPVAKCAVNGALLELQPHPVVNLDRQFSSTAVKGAVVGLIYNFGDSERLSQ
jgi:predicted RNA polymerase sigma factor